MYRLLLYACGFPVFYCLCMVSGSVNGWSVTVRAAPTQFILTHWHQTAETTALDLARHCIALMQWLSEIGLDQQAGAVRSSGACQLQEKRHDRWDWQLYTQQVIGDIPIKPGPPRNFVWDHSKKLASTRSLFRQQFLPVDYKFEAKDARKTILIKSPILDSTNGILS